ncbi:MULTISPECIES: RNA 3'-terminal phosphate cyclase [Salinibaculum]|uniref:RNA 3'-terminal phosphate cyclase n=1 Tax=Salinibaculum TaxID=2732368 RepID=UPI0030D4EC06
MLSIDGATGGGQILRTALTLAAVTDTPFRIENIRGERPEPGLGAQHLAAVDLAADLCDATVEGAERGAESLTFEPGEERQTSLSVAVGTAGSLTLLFDAVLPVAAVIDDPLRVTATGGTDVKWSPTMAYFRRVKLPLLARFGLDAAVTLDRTGFYPAGGGEATLTAGPSSLSPLALDSRGTLDRVDVYSKASESLEERDVADRQADQATDRLTAAGFSVGEPTVEYVPAHSPGSALLVAGVYEDTVAGGDALGEPGRTSEAVADSAVDRFLDFHDGDAAVDEHMADQVLVYLALAGGRVRIPAVTDHVETNLAVLSAFDSDLSLEREGDGAVVEASPHPSLR